MEGNNTSYWLYQLYETRGSQDPIPAYPNTYSVDGEGTMPLVVRKESDDECGYVTYRWVNLPITNAYICDDCGYVPTIYKWEAKYDSSQWPEHKVGCSEGSVITSGETHPAYQEHFYPAKIEYLEIGECVTEIDDDAFKGIGSTSRYGVKVIFGDNITRIGNSAFRDSDNWTASDISLPASLRTIGDYAFYSCEGLTGNLTIPSGVTSIGMNAFNGCRNLNSLTLSASLRTIGNYAFNGCEGFTGNLTMPSGVTTIGDYAFYRCSGFTGDLAIPNSVTTIGRAAFSFCTGFTSVTIGSGVTSIGISAFAYCRSLTGITVDVTTPPTLGGDAFSTTNNCPIYVPCESVIAYKAASGWSTYESRIFPKETCLKAQATYSDGNTLSVMCDNKLYLSSGDTKPSGYQYTAMTEAVVGDCVTGITDGAFEDCSSLTSVTMSDSVTRIDYYVFDHCSSLTSIGSVGSGASVEIPNSVTRIGTAAFRYCSGLTSVTIPDSVTRIDTNAFYSCRSLTSATIGNGVTSIGSYAFYQCSGLTELNIGNSVTGIGSRAFSGCRSLTSLTLPNGVTTIGESAFGACSGLTSLVIPDSVTSIDMTAFRSCKRLTSITVNATTPPSLGNSAFDDTNNCPIYVPAASVNAYKTANVWIGYKSRIKPIP